MTLPATGQQHRGCVIPPSCNTQSSAPEDWRDHRPKHVELIGIINKPLLLHLVGCLYYCNTNYIYHKSVLQMKVSWSFFIACPSPIVSEFCIIRFILPWVFRYLFLPSFYLFPLFSSCFCFVLFFFLLLNCFPLLPFLHTLPVFQNCSQLSVCLSFLLFFEWSCVYNKNLREEKILSQAFNIGANIDNTTICLKVLHEIL